MARALLVLVRYLSVCASRLTTGCSGRSGIKCQGTYGSAPPLNRDVIRKPRTSFFLASFRSRHQRVGLFVARVVVAELASQSSRSSRVFCQRSGSALLSAAVSAVVEWALAKHAVSERASSVVNSASVALSGAGHKSQRGLAVRRAAGVL